MHSVRFSSMSKCEYCCSPKWSPWASARTYQTSRSYNGMGDVIQSQSLRAWTKPLWTKLVCPSRLGWLRGKHMPYPCVVSAERTVWMRNREQLEWDVIFQWQILAQDMPCFSFKVLFHKYLCFFYPFLTSPIFHFMFWSQSLNNVCPKFCSFSCKSNSLV